METYIQKEIINSTESAFNYIRNKIWYSLLYTEFLTARLAYDLAEQENLVELNELENILRASRIPKEIQEAGDKLGSRFLKTVSAFDLHYDNQIFDEFIQTRNNQPSSYPIAYGVWCASLGIEIKEALENYLYSQVSSMVTNAVKSIPLSQTDGQKMLSNLSKDFDLVIDKVMNLCIDDLGRTTPGFDLRSMEHEKLYSRIFMS